MIEVHCPRCDAILEAPDTAAGKIIGCPKCDADISVPVPASALVIDVHAEGLNEPEPDPTYEDDPFFNPKQQTPHTGPAVQQTIWIQRGGDGSGCCLLGCLGILLILFLAIRGFLSLF